jgi:hypothetical protein
MPRKKRRRLNARASWADRAVLRFMAWIPELALLALRYPRYLPAEPEDVAFGMGPIQRLQPIAH